MVFASRVDLEGEYNTTANLSLRYHCSLANNITTSFASNITNRYEGSIYGTSGAPSPTGVCVAILLSKLFVSVGEDIILPWI